MIKNVTTLFLSFYFILLSSCNEKKTSPGTVLGDSGVHYEVWFFMFLMKVIFLGGMFVFDFDVFLGVGGRGGARLGLDSADDA